ncbi:MAG: ABC transporter permease [Deinococcota bacterium]|nr:ABC transporter permease [Deinococcota bacterium]
MRARDYFTEALENVRAAKLRSFLTSLGIIIGIGSVVLLIAIGQGVNARVTGAFADLGSTRITISPSAPREGGGSGGFGGPPGLIASTLTLEDAAALAGVEGVAAVAPVIVVPVRVTSPEESLATALLGTSPAYGEVTGLQLVAGRVFAEASSEVVLNEAAATALFAGADPLGSAVSISGRDFDVVGVYADQLSPFAQFAADSDEERVRPVLFAPVEEALSLAATERVAQIVLVADSPERVELAMAGVRSVLLERRGGVADFSTASFQELLASFTQIFDTLTLFLAAIAGISLLVGGIGIMNIMLVTVTERTREIGIAKAIGATRGNVVIQFLVEAVFLSVLGGVLGVAFAWLGTVVLAQTLDLPAIITPSAVSLAVGVSALIGIFFGVFPAWRAARLDPIVALRHQ